MRKRRNQKKLLIFLPFLLLSYICCKFNFNKKKKKERKEIPSTAKKSLIELSSFDFKIILF